MLLSPNEKESVLLDLRIKQMEKLIEVCDIAKVWITTLMEQNKRHEEALDRNFAKIASSFLPFPTDVPNSVPTHLTE